jgi:hypothetical protein
MFWRTLVALHTDCAKQAVSTIVKDYSKESSAGETLIVLEALEAALTPVCFRAW